jgi:hypothetical protein
MLNWLKAAQLLHAALAFLAAFGLLRFLVRTRFWLPRYVHWMAVLALGIGLGLLWLTPQDAPLNRGGWIGLKKAAIVLLFPGIVYVAFVFYGGQRSTFQARRRQGLVRCAHCRDSAGLPGDVCAKCGQTIPSSHPPGS